MQVKMHIFYMPDCHIASKNAYILIPTTTKARKESCKRAHVSLLLVTPPQPNVKKNLQNEF